MLWRIFGPKKEEVTGDWRSVHNEELHGLYSSSNISRMINSKRTTIQGHTEHKGEMRNQVFVEEPAWKRTLGRPKRRWKDNIKMDL
jgi:hypothetical protein